MSTAEWSKVKTLFADAVERPPEERSAFLDEACAGDESLRERLESLLAAHASERNFLDNPANVAAGQESATADGLEGRTIGNYRVGRALAAGGMGVVYLAEQISPPRTVALKVLRPAMVARGDALLRRFELEGRALAQLQHPGIAQIFEAGTFDIGQGIQPFFAMEYIRGAPLTRFASEQRLDTRQRLELLAAVCDAVHHAHQKGVIHRDLKPDNILVMNDELRMTNDERRADRGCASSGPRPHSSFVTRHSPKILDFGVAKFTDDDRAATLQTDVGQIIGTIAYMSPEQVAGRSDQLDIRADVYALGVTAYELLAGRLPYDLSGRALADAARVIGEIDPPALAMIDKSLAGDVSTIVAKAMEKDRERRYQSASELAADIRRHLHDEPIAARPQSSMYQLRKFARRNRALVVGAAVLLLVLVAASIVSTVGFVRATRATEESARQARIAQAVNEFLNKDLLPAADPANAPDPNITMRQALDAAATRIHDRFAGEPAIEAAVRTSLGVTYQALGEYDVAEPHLQRALDLTRGALGDDHIDTLRAEDALALLRTQQGRLDEAEAALAALLERGRRLFGVDHPAVLTIAEHFADVHAAQGNFAQAQELHERTLESRRRQFGPRHPATLVSMNNLGVLYWRQGAYGQAESLLSNTIEARREILGEDHPDTLISINNLGLVLNEQGRFDEAEPRLREVLEKQRRRLGDDHSNTLTAMNNLGQVYQSLGRTEEAEALYRESIEARRRTMGAEHWLTLSTMNNLALLLHRIDRLDEAEDIWLGVLEAQRRTLGPEHVETLVTLSNLARLYVERARHEEAAALYAEAVDGARRSLPKDHWYTGVFLMGQGRALTATNQFEAAEAALLEAHRTLSASFAPDHKRVRDAASALVRLYEQWGRPDQAAAFHALVENAPE